MEIRTAENTCVCEIEKTADISIFGKTLAVKNYVCSKNGCPYKEKEKPIKLQLSICPTSFCGGRCPFCVAAETKGKREFLDIKKLEKTLLPLHEQNILRGIGITGGEPFTDVGLLNDIVELIFDIFGIEFEIYINTNGSGLRDMHKLRHLEYIDTIHISRHHYDDERNRRYFLLPDIPGEQELTELVKSVNDPQLFVYNCLLLKDGIGTKEDMAKMLEFAARTGVPKVGFVTPMPVNEYVKKNMVGYTELFDREDDRFLFTASYRDFEFCHCQDGLYFSQGGKLVELYGRETAFGNAPYVRGMVYNADNVLRTGFAEDSELIYKP